MNRRQVGREHRRGGFGAALQVERQSLSFARPTTEPRSREVDTSPNTAAAAVFGDAAQCPTGAGIAPRSRKAPTVAAFARKMLSFGARSRREMNKGSANRALMRTALPEPERGGVPPSGLLVPGHVINQAFFRKLRLSAAFIGQRGEDVEWRVSCGRHPAPCRPLRSAGANAFDFSRTPLRRCYGSALMRPTARDRCQLCGVYRMPRAGGCAMCASTLHGKHNFLTALE